MIKVVATTTPSVTSEEVEEVGGKPKSKHTSKPNPKRKSQAQSKTGPQPQPQPQSAAQPPPKQCCLSMTSLNYRTSSAHHD